MWRAISSLSSESQNATAWFIKILCRFVLASCWFARFLSRRKGHCMSHWPETDDEELSAIDGWGSLHSQFDLTNSSDFLRRHTNPRRTRSPRRIRWLALRQLVTPVSKSNHTHLDEDGTVRQNRRIYIPVFRAVSLRLFINAGGKQLSANRYILWTHHALMFRQTS